MKIKTIEVGVISTNCYLVSDNLETIIIDPGDESHKIVDVIEKSGLIPKLCLLTHVHFDHVLAVVDVIEQYKIPLMLHERDMFLLKEVDNINRIEDSIEFVDRKSVIELGDLKFNVIETPGHTPGSISLYCKDKDVVFVGDLLFSGGFLGRTDFGYGDEHKLYESIRRILKLPASTRVYPGHGPSFLLSEWK